MRGIALGVAAALLIGTMPIQAMAGEQPSAAITSADFLKADGKNLKNNYGTGDVVNLRGTNAGGYLLQEFWMTATSNSANVSDQKDIMSTLTERFGEDKMYELIAAYEDAYWTEADFDRCAAMGMNCIRLPFWWRNLTDENGAFYGYDETAVDPYAAAFERMDWFVQEASERGLYVIIDFHGVPGSQNGSDHSGVDGGDGKEAASEFWFGDNAEWNQQLYYEIWKVVAARYAGNPAVAGYDLMNEPFCTYRYSSSKTADELHQMLWGVYDKAYDTIRSVDPDHVIIMEAVWDPGDLPNPVEYDWQNVMYEYHNYLYDDYDNAAGNQISNMESKLSSIGNTDYNVPSYLGEFSYFNNLEAWDEGLELLVDSGINWTTWTYKTIAGYGNWGLYHHPASMDEGINIETATEEEILACWQAVGTSEENVNAGLVEVVKKWCEADTSANQMGPRYADIADGTYYFLGNSSQRVLTNTGDEKGNMIGAIGLKMEDDAAVKFALTHNDDNTVSLKSLSNDKYVSVGSEDKLLRATADDITDTEKFYLMQSSATAVALKSVSTQLFACVDEDLETERDYFEEGFPIIANRSSATSWETFNVYTMDRKLIGDVSDENYSGWTRYEAENTAVADIFGGGIEEQSFYSGGQAAGNMNTPGLTPTGVEEDWSNIKYVAFRVNAEVAGSYKLVMTYNGDDDKEILVKVGSGTAETVQVPRIDNGEWDHIHQKSVMVDLQAGENTIYISGAVGDGWMNLDCIDLINYPLASNADGSERYEAEKYYTNGSKEGQSFYSGGVGVGSLNSNTAFDSIAANWSNIKYVDFTIYAEEAGNYIVNWAWNGNGSDGMKAAYCVNRGENVPLILNNAGASWNSMNRISFTVPLEKGFNDLKISGTIEEQTNWANIDYIDVVRDGSQIEVAELPKAVSGWTRYEGELEATLVNGGGIEAQDFYSNGKAIGNLSTDSVAAKDVKSDWSNIPYAEFTLDMAQAGEYRMTLAYNGDDDKVIAFQVNEGETQNISLPAVQTDHAWNVVHKKDMVISLVEGANTIRISGALGGGWCNIDYIDVANAPVCIETETGAERYEAENFDCKSANNPPAEHQDFYSGTANANGVGGMGATDNSFEVGADILGTRLNYIDYSIFAEKAGTYDITIAGNGNGSDMTCVYQLNDAVSASFQLFNDGFPWDHMVYAVIRVDLKAGYNRFILAGTWNGDWLNYDYIDVKPIESDKDNGGSGNDSGETGDAEGGGNTENTEETEDSGSTGNIESTEDGGNTESGGNIGTGGNTESGGNAGTGGNIIVTENVIFNGNAAEENYQENGKSMRRFRSTNGTDVSICGEASVMPEGVQIFVEQMSTECSNYKKAQTAVGARSDVQKFLVYDIDLKNSAGAEFHQMDGYVNVTMPLPTELKDAVRVTVYRMEEDGHLVKCATAVKGGYITFSTNHFSTFVFVHEGVNGAPKTSDENEMRLCLAMLLLLAGVAIVNIAKKKKIFYKS